MTVMSRLQPMTRAELRRSWKFSTDEEIIREFEYWEPMFNTWQEIRKLAGMGQHQAAEYAGIPYSTFHAWETGKEVPSCEDKISCLSKLLVAAYFGAEKAELMKEALKKYGKKYDAEYSFAYMLDGKRIPLITARKLFGTDLGKYRAERCNEDGSTKKIQTPHGILEIEKAAPPYGIKMIGYICIDYAPGWYPFYPWEKKELIKHAQYELNGEIISKEEAEVMFFKERADIEEYTGMSAGLFFSDYIQKYATDYGTLRILFPDDLADKLMDDYNKYSRFFPSTDALVEESKKYKTLDEFHDAMMKLIAENPDKKYR